MPARGAVLWSMAGRPSCSTMGGAQGRSRRVRRLWFGLGWHSGAVALMRRVRCEQLLWGRWSRHAARLLRPLRLLRRSFVPFWLLLALFTVASAVRGVAMDLSEPVLRGYARLIDSGLLACARRCRWPGSLRRVRMGKGVMKAWAKRFMPVLCC